MQPTVYCRRFAAWLPIRAAFRYVTQRPWNRIPVNARTVIFNPVRGASLTKDDETSRTTTYISSFVVLVGRMRQIVACLAGGRNKGMAAKAYEMLNQQLAGTGLAVRVPATHYDVPLKEVRAMVERMGGHAVIKVPYANAGAWGVRKGRAPTKQMVFAYTQRRFRRLRSTNHRARRLHGDAPEGARRLSGVCAPV